MTLFAFFLITLISTSLTVSLADSQSIGVILLAYGGMNYVNDANEYAARIAAQGVPVTLFVREHTPTNTLHPGINVVKMTDEEYADYDPSFLIPSVKNRRIGQHGPKIWVMQNTPYDFTVFLDTDTYPCMNMKNIISAAQLLMENHYIAAERFCSPGGNAGFCYSSGGSINSGVIFFKRKSAVLQNFLFEWKQQYRKDVETFVSCFNHESRSTCSYKQLYAQDQPSFAAVNARLKLPILGLGPAWNCKILRQMQGGQPPKTPTTCCTPRFQEVFGLSCIIDHKCESSGAYNYSVINNE